MKTERLITMLAADAASRERSTGSALALALLAALPVSIVLFIVTLGVRDDVHMAMRNPFFDLKFAVTLTLAVTAIILGLHLSRPEASPRGWMWLLLAPVLLIAAGIVGEMMMPQSQPWLTRLIGNSALACLMSIPVFSLPLLVAVLLALRRGAPARPALAGAVAGLIAAGLGATLYASHCADDSPLFVAVWYSMAAGLMAIIGAIAGRRLLRY